MAWDIASRYQNKLFRQSRLRLATWYAGVMGAILTLAGFGLYTGVVHAHRITVDRELYAIAEAIQDALEPSLREPNRLPQLSSLLLPNLCVIGYDCLTPNTQLYQRLQQDYYIRLINPEGTLVATAGLRPSGLPVDIPEADLQSLRDTEQQLYHQVAIALQTTDQQSWGYLLVGRSFQDFEQYLAAVRLGIIAGLLGLLILVALASWWLAARAMEPIYQSYQQIQQFTGDAAHELRTPLAAIRATVESVLRLPHLSEADAQETLTVIGRQNKRLTELVNDLLLLSRLDSERSDKPKVPCCLQDIILDIEEELVAFAIAKQITLTVDITELQSILVMGDEAQLYRLILNLVNNAITYTSAGGQVNLSLHLSLQRQPQALIKIKDTGLGISPDHQTKIFDRFYQVDTARAGHNGNSGLGLAIASAIARAHGGSIEVDSVINQGSIFTISLPISP